jgi:ParB family chromosome partitioning protein
MSTAAVEPGAAAPRIPKVFALRDLDVAPENMRFGEPPDDGIPELAETIFAAGLLQPLTVRPGHGRRERPGMALDGRRRLLALGRLRDAGRIPDDYPVEAFVETDPARQAAAIVLTNTAVPVHLADVILAIGKMLKAKLTPAVIAGALGYAEIDVRRLAALAGLHPKALEALKAGRLNQRQAKLLARLPDRKAQGEIAEAAISGFGFQEWRITDRLDAGQVTVRDRRFRLVGPERYVAAGGRLESDLFGERPDVILDPDTLQAAWMARAQALAQSLAGDGVEISVGVSAAQIDDPALEPFGEAYGMGLDAEGLGAWEEAQAAVDAAEAALADADLSSPEVGPAVVAYLAARLACDRASEPPREVVFLQVFSDAASGLNLCAYGPPAPEVIEDGEVDFAADDEVGGTAFEASAFGHAPSPSVAATPVAVAPRPEIEGVGHSLHEVRTDMATRALIRALADDPGAALVAVIARLFAVEVLRQGRGRGGGALSLDAETYGRVGASPI